MSIPALHDIVTDDRRHRKLARELEQLDRLEATHLENGRRLTAEHEQRMAKWRAARDEAIDSGEVPPPEPVTEGGVGPEVFERLRQKRERLTGEHKRFRAALAAEGIDRQLVGRELEIARLLTDEIPPADAAPLLRELRMIWSTLVEIATAWDSQPTTTPRPVLRARIREKAPTDAEIYLEILAGYTASFLLADPFSVSAPAPSRSGEAKIETLRADHARALVLDTLGEAEI
jgi:hypothetical protein